MSGWVRVFAHPNALLVSHVHNVLESAGVPTELRNLTLGGGAGEFLPGRKIALNLPVNPRVPESTPRDHYTVTPGFANHRCRIP